MARTHRTQQARPRPSTISRRPSQSAQKLRRRLGDGYDYDRAVRSRVAGEQDIVVGVFPKDGLLNVVFRPNPSIVCGTVLR